jgi:hypothetical protein
VSAKGIVVLRDSLILGGRLTGRLRCQQVLHDGLEESHGMIETVFDGGIAQLRQIKHANPTGGFTQ